MEGIAPLAGAVIGDEFRIVKLLGEGGMGAVYLAEQLSTGRRRALKLMHPRLVADAKLRGRFERESRVSARIDSAHVVEVISSGIDAATGMPWIAMELLAGVTLDAVIERGPVAPEEAHELLAEIGSALGAAHRAGVVHRDLKPENVFIARSRQEGRVAIVKVLDFGIAKVVAEAGSTTTSAIGTPRWMAPEQADAKAVIAPSTDVWPFGLIAFSLLTGRSFWLSAEDDSAFVLMSQILMSPIPSASERAREIGAPTLPAGFDAWFARCVTRERSARFPDGQSATTALVEALGPRSGSPSLTTVRAALDAPSGAAAPAITPGEGDSSGAGTPPLKEASALASAPTELKPHPMDTAQVAATTGAPAIAALPARPPRRAYPWYGLVAGAGVVATALAVFVALRGPKPPVAPSARTALVSARADEAPTQPPATSSAELAPQPSPPSVPPDFRGSWNGTDGYRFVYLFHIDIDKDGHRAAGFFEWRLTAAPPGPLVARINDSGREVVSGTYDASTRLLSLEGKYVDTVGLLGTDQYKLTVSKDGHTLDGTSRGNQGTWQNQMHAIVSPQPFTDAAVGIFRFDDPDPARPENLVDGTTPNVLDGVKSDVGHEMAGGAIALDGKGGGALHALPKLDGKPATTVSVWIKAHKTQPKAVLIERGADAAGGLLLSLDTTGALPSFACDPASHESAAAVAPAGALDGRWHHLVGSCDAGLVRIFLDGKEGMGGSAPRDFKAASAPLVVGRAPNGTSGFEGSMDELRVYDRALLPDEVREVP